MDWKDYTSESASLTRDIIGEFTGTNAANAAAQTAAANASAAASAASAQASISASDLEQTKTITLGALAGLTVIGGLVIFAVSRRR